jgi:hypothetical protein
MTASDNSADHLKNVLLCKGNGMDPAAPKWGSFG